MSYSLTKEEISAIAHRQETTEEFIKCRLEEVNALNRAKVRLSNEMSLCCTCDFFKIEKDHWIGLCSGLPTKIKKDHYEYCSLYKKGGCFNLETE